MRGLRPPQVSDSSVSVEPSLSVSTFRGWWWRGLHGEPTRGGVREGGQPSSGVAVTTGTKPVTWVSLGREEPAGQKEPGLDSTPARRSASALLAGVGLPGAGRA